MKGLFAYNLYIKPKFFKLSQFSTPAQYLKLKKKHKHKKKNFSETKKKKKHKSKKKEIFSKTR